MNRASLGMIRLIALREITLRLRSKAFVLTTVLTALVVVAAAVVISLVQGGGPSTTTVAVLAEQRPILQPLLVTSAQGSGTTLKLATVDDDAAGRSAVSEGDASAYVRADAPGRLDVVVEEDLGNTLSTILDSAARQRVLAAQVDALGGDPTAVSSAIGAATLAVTALKPPPDYDPQRLVLGVIAGILIYLALMLAGQLVAQGVVEEKASRVVELLLAAVRPWQLLTGKVLGLGFLGLVQVIVIGGSGVIAGLATGSLDLPVSAAAGIVGWLVAWFLLGYLAYAFTFAALGALVSRQEDVAGVVTPVTMVLVVGYVIGVSVLPADPGNTLVAVLSMIPVFSPTLMPIRLAIGGVPWWQTALSLGLMLVTIPLLVALAARIYRNAVVRAGARVKLRNALRSA